MALNLLSTAAAFGIARLVFQDGAFERLLGFESQGFLLDATLIRLLLQPVVLRLLGRHAWWMPTWLDRLLPDVSPAHDGPAAEPAPA